MQLNGETTYEQWMKKEGIPIVDAYGIRDVRQIDRQPWARMNNGLAAFIQLKGMEGFTGMYVAEIAGGKALAPERHLYEEVIYILEGTGVTEVWDSNRTEKRVTFEWGPGSMFALPLNSWHRLVNREVKPVIFLALTSAPVMMDLLHNEEFIFNCDYSFSDRFEASPDYFKPSEKRYRGSSGARVWDTNFIPDVVGAAIPQGSPEGRRPKAFGGASTLFQMAENALVGHIAEWPAGSYHKAHWHGGGAVIFPVSSEGYVLLWPREVGIRPYEAGHGDKVVKVDWRAGSVYSPPTGWFHQHFNTGREKARHVAFRYSGNAHKYTFGIFRASSLGRVNVSIREGGNLIEYGDEDPQIRKDYEAELKMKGIECEMPPVLYGKH